MKDLGSEMRNWRPLIADFQLTIADRKLKIRRRNRFVVTRIVVLLTMAMIGVTCAGEKEAAKGTIQGTIYVIGNEPFTSLAVEVSEGRMYRLSTSTETRQRLLALQGRKVMVEYSRIDTTAEGITLSVDKFKEIAP